MAEAIPATPATPPATPAGQPQPIVVKTATGQEYKGNTYEEVVAELVKAQENATRTIAEQNQRLQSAPPPTPTPQSPDDVWNPARYYELLAQDPMLASAYQGKHDPGYQRLRKMAEVVEENQMVNEFKTICDDFPDGNDAASGALVEVANRITQSKNIPLSTEVLVTAHKLCLKSKLYEPVTPNLVQTPAPPANMPPPPPPASTGTASPEAGSPNPWAMSMDELEAAIKAGKQ